MSNFENKKNIEGSKILIVAAGDGKGTVMGGEFEFCFIGWSLEKSFIFVSVLFLDLAQKHAVSCF